MVPGIEHASVGFSDEPGMVCHLPFSEEDLDLLPALMHLYFFAEEAFGNGVTVRIHRDISRDIDHPEQALVDRRQIGGERLQVRLFKDVGGIGAHAQGSLELRIGGVPAPLDRLSVEVLPVEKGAPGQEIALHIREWALDPGLSITVPHLVSDKGDIKDASKPFHLGSHAGIGPGALGHDDAGVVDDASGAGPVHEAKGLGEKVAGFKAGEGGVIADEDPPAVAEREGGALGANFLSIQLEIVGRRIVLHLHTGAKVVAPGPFGAFVLSQAQLAHHAGEGGVGNGKRVLL